MARDPQAPFRRAALVAAIVLFAVIAGMNFSTLGAILARPEPHRTLRLGVAVSSVSLGIVAVGLLVRDLRGRGLPISACLQPAWLVFGLHLLDFYFYSKRALFLVTALAAMAMGLVGLTLLALALRRGARA